MSRQTLLGYFRPNLPANFFTGAKHPAFSTNLLADINKTFWPNYNQLWN